MAAQDREAVHVSVALVWFRRDLRLQDNPALQAALEAGHDVVPVYIHAPHEEGDWAPGAASNAWRHRSLAALDGDLRARSSSLVLRTCLLYTSPSPRDLSTSRMPSSA